MQQYFLFQQINFPNSRRKKKFRIRRQPHCGNCDFPQKPFRQGNCAAIRKTGNSRGNNAFDMRVNGESRLFDIAALLMYVNARLWIGHFDLWPEDGTIVFRHAMIFPEAHASASQCEALLNLALEACEHYYPAFQFVLWGGKSAEEAVAAAILECQGQA